MCFLKKSHSVRNSRTLLEFYNNHTKSWRTHLLSRTISPAQTSCLLLYSTQKHDNLKGLTDEILQSKVRAEKKNDSEKAEAEQPKDSGSKGKKESKWTGKNAWKLGLVFLGGWAVLSGGGLLYIWGSPPLDPDGNEVKDEFSDLPTIQAYMKRASNEFSIFRKKIQDPSRDKLLPDPLQYPYMQPPYTLVLEMTGILVHPDWTYSTGWRFKKRPGVEYFLQQLGPPLFEIVVYTSEQGYTADPLINNLDPQGYVMYRLYRDATRYMNGHHVKDLSCLNRDLSKVIYIDWDPKSYQLQPRNTFPLKKWSGSDEDRTLIDLAHFLKTVAASGVEDIRTVMDYYSQFADPIEAFKENQRKFQEEQDRQAKELQAKEQKKTGSWGGFSVFSRR